MTEDAFFKEYGFDIKYVGRGETECCNGEPYNTATDCCENGKVVHKRAIWVGRRKLSGYYNCKIIPRIPGLSHVVYTDDPSIPTNRSNSNIHENKIMGKVPGTEDLMAMVYSKGIVKDESQFGCYKYNDYDWENYPILMCPSQADKLLGKKDKNAGIYMMINPLSLINFPWLITIFPIWGNSRCGNCAGWGK